MSVSVDQKLHCLELALRCTTNNKDRAMDVAAEFIAFIGRADEEQADKPEVKPRKPRKTAGKTAETASA